MSATEAEIKAAVLVALHRIAPDADLESLPPTANLRESLDIDSFDFLQLLIALNKQLGIDVPEADYGKLQTMATLVPYLVAHQS